MASAVMLPPPVDVATTLASLDIDSSYSGIYEDCCNLILYAQKSNQLGKDDRDPAYKRIRMAKQDLDDAIKALVKLTEAPCSDSEKDGKTSKLKKLKERIRKYFRRGSSLRESLKLIEAAFVSFNGQYAGLKETTKNRSTLKRLGSYNVLCDLRVLVSNDSETAYDLKGRYEETGKRLYELVIDLASVASELESRQKLFESDSSFGKAKPIFKSLHQQLAGCCSDIISFILSVPFDLDSFNSAEEVLARLVGVLKSYVTGALPFKTLFDIVELDSRIIEAQFQDNFEDELDENPFKDEEPVEPGINETVTVPVDVSSSNVIKEVLRHEQLRQEIVAISKCLAMRKAKYKEKKVKFESLPRHLPACERALPRLGLKPRDFERTDLVVECMKRPRDDSAGGLGLTVICKSSTTKAKKQHYGGYGIVSCMELPEDAKGIDPVKVTNRLVAVKVVGGSMDTATANLRMLREADRWASVSSDPRKLAGGGKYLAEVLGIWEDFQDGRPGLVSLWATHKLSEYIQPEMSVSHRLDLASKVAQGVLYLHTSNPVIIHGDIKGDNVIMVDGEPRLTDFGIAKCLDNKPGYTTRDASYSDAHRAPEIQYCGISLVRYPSKKSDVYAFGCLLFETLSGNSPYKGIAPQVRTNWINSNMDYTPLDAEMLEQTEAPFPFESTHVKLMKRCFNFHAKRRPTMEEVIDELKSY